MQVPLLLSSVLLSAAGLSAPVLPVPGLADWQAALAAHAAAEGRLAGSSSLASAPATDSVPGFHEWQAQQAAVLAAERNLQNKVSLLEGRGNTQPESVFSSSSSTPTSSSPESSTSSLESSSVSVLSSTTDSSTTVSAGFKNILKSSLTKLLEEVQEAKSKSNKDESLEVLLKSHDFEEKSQESFLDKLLKSLQNKSASDLKDEGKKGPKVAEKKKDDRSSAELDTDAEDLNVDIAKFLAALEDFEESDYSNDISENKPEEDRSLNNGLQIGSFLQEELNSAAAESEQLSLELEQLLQQLEEEKQKDLKFLEDTFAIINSKLEGATFKDLRKDEEFGNSVFQRFALLGLPLRDEDISLKALMEAKKIVTQNVLEAALESRNIALDIKQQLDGNIRRKGRNENGAGGLRDIEETLKTVLNLIQ